MTLNNRLIEAIIEHAQSNRNIANQLSDILSIGKEAVYRRLRDEVPFSFTEAGKIALALNISLDQIVSVKSENRGVFELQFPDSTDMVRDYTHFFDYYIKLLTEVESYDNSKLMIVYNSLPPSCFLNYDELFRFLLYKNVYQLKSDSTFAPYSEIPIPSQLSRKQHHIATLLRNIKSTFFIIDWTVFPSFIHEVQHFYKLGLLNLDEMKEIQKELNRAVDDLEGFTVSGCFPNGNKVMVYLSNIDFTSSHAYIEYGPYYFGHQVLFSMNMIMSQNPDICRKQKSWIDILIKYSTLISQSGEIERIRYMKTQREYIANMTDLSTFI
ncbi:hypothetical protein [Proteiniphilum sp. UBA5384]|uniref:hypothetical protein n=1 Tax=Proteiniphilum sp. UBA5384 TaxID=1947279 RepID=UPI0025FCAD70|nr:hypothetical protein [Proteiniphilum sp. UBA5384]